MFSVIFDMDGTLIDTQRVAVPAWEYAGKNQGIEHVGDLVKYVCGMNEVGWSQFLLDHHPQIDIVKFNTDARNYIKENVVVRFMPGAEELIDFLKQNNIKTASS